MGRASLKAGREPASTARQTMRLLLRRRRYEMFKQRSGGRTNDRVARRANC